MLTSSPTTRPVSGRALIPALLGLVRFQHTVFALPFAFAGALMARNAWPPLSVLGWIVLAMVGARSLAMAINRLVDRQRDARNPRTAGRHLPAGRLSATQVRVFAAVSLVALLVAVSQLPTITWWLWPIPVALFVIYPYSKRFTWACHVILGLSIGIAPIGAWIAVTGQFAWAPVLLWAAVATWIAGFDVIYALLDFDSDHQDGTYSVPVRFGEMPALRIALAAHVVTVLLLVWAGVAAGVMWPYYVAVGVSAAILAWEHLHVRPSDVARINAAFGAANMVMSVVFFVGVVAQVAVA